MQAELTKVEILSKEKIRERLFNEELLNDEIGVKELIKDLTALFISLKTDRPHGHNLGTIVNIITFLLEPLLPNGFIKIHRFGSISSPSLIIESYNANDGIEDKLKRCADPEQAKKELMLDVADILMSAHYDTVIPKGQLGDIEPYINNDWLYGRGAIDNKGQLACLIILLAKMAFYYDKNNSTKKLPSVVLTILGDEETRCEVSRRFLRAFDARFKIDLEPTGRYVGVYSNKIRGEKFIKIKTQEWQTEDCVLTELKKRIEELILKEYPEARVHISHVRGTLHCGIQLDPRYRFKFPTGKIVTILQEKLRLTSNADGNTYEGFTSKLAPEYETKLNTALKNNIPLERLDLEHMVTETSEPTEDYRKVELAHDFDTAYTLALGGNDTNTVITSFADTIRHSNTEGLNLPHGVNLIKALFEFVINFHKPIEG
jgi:hypothetical protein